MYISTDNSPASFRTHQSSINTLHSPRSPTRLSVGVSHRGRCYTSNSSRRSTGHGLTAQQRFRFGIRQTELGPVFSGGTKNLHTANAGAPAPEKLHHSRSTAVRVHRLILDIHRQASHVAQERTNKKNAADVKQGPASTLRQIPFRPTFADLFYSHIHPPVK